MSVSVVGTWSEGQKGQCWWVLSTSKCSFLGTAGICLHGRWHPGAGQGHPGKGEDEEATPVTPLPVLFLQPGTLATKKTPKNPKDEVQTVPRTAQKNTPALAAGQDRPPNSFQQLLCSVGKAGRETGRTGGIFWDNPSPSLSARGQSLGCTRNWENNSQISPGSLAGPVIPGGVMERGQGGLRRRWSPPAASW